METKGSCSFGELSCDKSNYNLDKLYNNIKNSLPNVLSMIHDRNYKVTNEINIKNLTNLANLKNNIPNNQNDIVGINLKAKKKVVVRYFNINSISDPFLLKLLWNYFREYNLNECNHLNNIINDKKLSIPVYDIKILKKKLPSSATNKISYKRIDSILKNNFQILLNDYFNFREKFDEKYRYHTTFISIINSTDLKMSLNIKKFLVYDQIQIFNIKNVLFNVTKHILVPKHKYISDEDFLNDWKKKNTIEYSIDTIKSRLPKILLNDPIVSYYNFNINDIIKIIRKNQYGIDISYRIVSLSLDILDN